MMSCSINCLWSKSLTWWCVFSENIEGPIVTIDTSENKFDYDKSPAHYICNDGEVISYLGRCDNQTDCFDGSDEAGCLSTEGNHLINALLSMMFLFFH